MATSSTIHVVRDLRCESCGRETTRLFEDDHCAVCHHYHLTASEEARAAVLRTLGQSVLDAMRYEGVSPDDIREQVDQALTIAAKQGWADNRPRIRDVQERRREHEEFLADVLPVL